MLDAHRSPFQVETRHVGHQHPDVLPAPEDPPQREADLGGGEGTGGHLVAEGLEHVEVPPIDQRHLDVGTAKAMHRLQAAKAAPDHDHPMRLVLGHTAVTSRCSKTRR